MLLLLLQLTREAWPPLLRALLLRALLLLQATQQGFTQLRIASFCCCCCCSAARQCPSCLSFASTLHR
jgi:hypothetical protein